MIKTLKIVITGPESTGKSTLCKELADYYKSIYIPEYARKFMENLNLKYQYNDLVHIAGIQIKQLQKKYSSHKIIFFDTSLIITKIWFCEIYGKYPDFLDSSIIENKVDLYLLCYPDLEWIPDPVRENPGNKRKYLYNKYKNELEKFGFEYKIIKGKGQKRRNNSIKKISSAYSL